MFSRFRSSDKRRKNSQGQYCEDSVNIDKLDKTLSKPYSGHGTLINTCKNINPYDLYSSFQDALEYLEPLPVSPPDYSTLLQSSPRFPVYSYPNEGHEKLPQYTPAVYKLDKFVRKLEWVSPYDAAPTRHWKDVIIELNSTQLNVYYVESQHKMLCERLPTLPRLDIENYHNLRKNFRSRFTTERDLSNAIQYKKFQILKKSHLLKSYSLQYAKIGLLADYKKHKFTLRLRCETEQFLIQFPDAESMIEWNMALCLGRDNALDLDKRSMPHYRTVPRRRRHNLLRDRGSDDRHHHGRHYRRRRNNSEPDIAFRSRSSSVSNFFHRRRLTSNPVTPIEVEQGLRNRFHAILRNGGAGSSVNGKHGVVQSHDSFQYPSGAELDADEEFRYGEEEVGGEGMEEEEEEDDDEEEEDEEEEDDDEDEVNDVDVDEDDDNLDIIDDESSESIPEDVEQAISTIPHLNPYQHGDLSTFSSSAGESDEYSEEERIEIKWYPEFDRLPSNKRIIKDLIRCMSTLSTTERWCGRNIVKLFDSDKYNPTGILSARNSADSTRKGPVVGTRFVKEYVVTSKGLIPLN